METIKSIGASLKNNIPGAIIGGIAGFYSKKLIKTENKWAIAGLVLAGAIVGAAIEYKIKARTVKPALDAAKAKK